MRSRIIWFSTLFVVISLSVVSLSITPILGRGNTSSFAGLTLGLDLSGGAHLLYRIIPPDSVVLSDQDYQDITNIVSTRVNQFGVNEPNVQLLGSSPENYRVLVQIPGVATEQTISIFYSSNLVQYTGDELLEVGLDQVEAVIRNTLGDTPYTIVDSDQAMLAGQRQFDITFDTLNTATKDQEGNVIREGDAELLREALVTQFPSSIDILFTLDTIDTSTATMMGVDSATVVTDTPTIPLPTLEEIQAILDDNGHTEVSVIRVESPSNYANSFTARSLVALEDDTNALFHLDIAPTSTDYVVVSGTTTSLPSDLASIVEELVVLPNYTQADLFSHIANYEVSGGIEAAKELIGSTARLEFRWRQCGSLNSPPSDVSEAAWPLLRCTPQYYVAEIDAGINAADLTDAEATLQNNSEWVVTLQFNSEGEQDFFSATSNIVANSDQLAIYLDDRELIAPTASSGITGGRAVISGNFTAEEARRISVQLRAGTLPAELDLIQERVVDATLGADVLSRTLIAAAIGIALLALFLVLYYKLPGVIATLTLILYAVTLLALIKIIPITLTLSGAAAIVLSLGFAVDANILVAERVKEELRTGRNLQEAINSGFRRAWPAIRDSNFSTILIALVLFWFGDRLSVSIVQGFALTLTIGIVLSVIFSYAVNGLLTRFIASKLVKKSKYYTPVTERSLTETKAATAIGAGTKKTDDKDGLGS